MNQRLAEMEERANLEGGGTSGCLTSTETFIDSTIPQAQGRDLKQSDY